MGEALQSSNDGLSRGPEQQVRELLQQVAALERKLQTIRAEVVSEVQSKLRLNGGQNMTVSGSGFNWTFTANIPPPLPAGKPMQGEWMPGVEFCDGTTADLWAQNIVPPEA